MTRPETILILRVLSPFEALYVSRSSTRMNEAVAQAFSGGSRTPPSANEGNNIARTVTNELDSARFDPLLVRAVAKNAATSLESVTTRVDGLVRCLIVCMDVVRVLCRRLYPTGRRCRSWVQWPLHSKC